MDAEQYSYRIICVLLASLLVVLAGCGENAKEKPVTTDPVIVTPEVIEPSTPQAGDPDDQTPDTEEPSPEQPAEQPPDEIPTATTDGTLAFPKALADVPAFTELMDRLEDHLTIEASITADGDHVYDLDEDQRGKLLSFLEEDFIRIKSKASEEEIDIAYSEDYVELFLETSTEDESGLDPLETPWVEAVYMNSLLYQMVSGAAYGDLFFIVNLEDRRGNVTDSHYFVPSEMYHDPGDSHPRG